MIMMGMMKSSNAIQSSCQCYGWIVILHDVCQPITALQSYLFSICQSNFGGNKKIINWCSVCRVSKELKYSAVLFGVAGTPSLCREGQRGPYPLLQLVLLFKRREMRETSSRHIKWGQHSNWNSICWSERWWNALLGCIRKKLLWLALTGLQMFYRITWIHFTVAVFRVTQLRVISRGVPPVSIDPSLSQPPPVSMNIVWSGGSAEAEGVLQQRVIPMDPSLSQWLSWWLSQGWSAEGCLQCVHWGWALRSLRID